MNIILVRIYARSNQKTSFYSNENNAIFHTNQKGIFRETERTYGHKKRSTAVLQPLLTLNLIL